MAPLPRSAGVFRGVYLVFIFVKTGENRGTYGKHRKLETVAIQHFGPFCETGENETHYTRNEKVVGSIPTISSKKALDIG